MSTKWLSKLSDEELIKLHGYILGEGIAESIKEKNNYTDYLSVTFMENGWEGCKDPIETDYDFEDFNGIEICDWAGEKSKEYYSSLFREWMLNRFGVEYLDELLKEVLGLNAINYLDWSKTKEEPDND